MCKIRVLGLQRSGTNFLHALLQQNLVDPNAVDDKGKHRRLFSEQEINQYTLKNFNENYPIYNKEFAKHVHISSPSISCVKSFIKYIEGSNNQIFIFTIKNPNHWVNSIKKTGWVPKGISVNMLLSEYFLYLDKIDKYLKQWNRVIIISYENLLNNNIKDIIPMVKNINEEIKFKDNISVPKVVTGSNSFSRKENLNMVSKDFKSKYVDKNQQCYIDDYLLPLYNKIRS